MLTAKEKTNITYRLVVVLMVSVVRDLAYSFTNRPDTHMAASARTPLTLMLPELRGKTGRVPTKVLRCRNVSLASRFEIQKNIITQKAWQCSNFLAFPD